MITDAERRKHVKQFEQFNAATNSFRLKYACLPGDCKNALNYGFTGAYGVTSAYVNGNGDGDIGNRATNPAYNYSQENGVAGFELTNYWRHLAEAGLIDFAVLPQGVLNTTYYCNDTGALATGVQTPQSPLIKSSQNAPNSHPCGGWLITGPQSLNRSITQWSTGNHVFLNEGSFGNFGNSAQVPSANNNAYLAMMASDAAYIDTKLDDGLPLTGKVRAVGGNQNTGVNPRDLTPVSTGAAGAAACISTSSTPNVYNTSYTSNRACNLGMEAQF